MAVAAIRTWLLLLLPFADFAYALRRHDRGHAMHDAADELEAHYIEKHAAALRRGLWCAQGGWDQCSTTHGQCDVRWRCDGSHCICICRLVAESMPCIHRECTLRCMPPSRNMPTAMHADLPTLSPPLPRWGLEANLVLLSLVALVVFLLWLRRRIFRSGRSRQVNLVHPAST